MPAFTSPLATQASGFRSPADARLRKPWGLLLHTTGGGVTRKAKEKGRQPIEVALSVYRSSQNGANGYMWGGPHYVMDHDGVLYQIAREDIRTAHAGGADRSRYLDGTWAKTAGAEVVARWKAQWPGKRHPYSLFPSVTPNEDYIGVEMIPVGDGFGGQPMAPDLRFTRAQHDAAVALARDCASRLGWPTGWQHTGRLVGHEDVQPLRRNDRLGGWDPGWLRAKPYFDFGYVRATV